MHKATHESEIELVELINQRIAHAMAIDAVDAELAAYRALIDALAKEVG